MREFDKLYESFEDVKMHYIGFIADDERYDFALVYTQSFFGKTMIIDMQAGRSILLDLNDLNDIDYLCKAFNRCSIKERDVLQAFFKSRLPAMPNQPQY